MIKRIAGLFKRFGKDKSIEEILVPKVQPLVEKKSENIKSYFETVIQNRDADGVEYGLALSWDQEKDDEFIEILHKLLVEDWHSRHEDIIHNLQAIKSPASIPYIKQAMQTKYEYLEFYGTGTRQFINQCGHALASIGTTEAIELIKELSNSNDPVLKDEMLYRISRIENTNNYKRNYNLD